jgi:hypothetical protein
MTKKRPCTQSGFAKKKLWNKNLAKISTNTQKNEFWQAPILSLKLLFLDQIKHHKNRFTANRNIKINSPISHKLGDALLL